VCETGRSSWPSAVSSDYVLYYNAWVTSFRISRLNYFPQKQPLADYTEGIESLKSYL